MNCTLSYTNPDGTHEEHPLAAGTHEIGRDPGCAVVLSETSVSRRHARLTVGEGNFTVEDLGSTSGTWLGAERLEGPRSFENARTIRLGDCAVTIDPQARDPSPDEAPPQRITVREDASRRQLPVLPGVEAALVSRLEDLYELPLHFASAADLKTLCHLILSRFVELIPGAKRGALLVLEPDTGKLALRASLPAEEPPISRTLVLRAASERLGFIWTDDDPGDKSQSIISLRIRTGMYVPLLWKDRTLGVLCVDNPRRKDAFTGEDLKFLIFGAHYAAAAVANQLLQDDIEQNNRTLQHLLANFSPKLRSRLLQKSREGRLQPGGELSDVTILMSDLRGFTRVSAEAGSAATVDMLNDYFSVLGEIIFQHDGTIDKFIGDAILAVFGSPEPDADHALKAVRCALAMRGALEQINDRRKQAGFVCCDAGIGIATGEVLHGFIGAAERLEFTVIGDTVNKAARYCDGARAGEILFSPATWARLRGEVMANPRKIPTKHEGDLDAYALG